MKHNDQSTTTSSAPPRALDVFDTVRETLHVAKRWSIPMKVEVMAGNVDRFVHVVDESVGLRTPFQEDNASKATLFGMTVLENSLLPPNFAAVMVNGELSQIIRFE
jgi:hypothetical protein